MKAIALVLAIGITLFSGDGETLAQTTAGSDYTVQITATVSATPPKITLSWPADPSATGYKLYRKRRMDATFPPSGTPLAANATNYVDSNVVVGDTWEYRVVKSTATYDFNEGYLYAGIQVAPVESRGKVILLVDNTVSSALAAELVTLQQDLAGDGWTVLRHDVARGLISPGDASPGVGNARLAELAAVKSLIMADYDADPANVKAVFLFGHPPVPYSGVIAPDDHTQHTGAWPADGYYGSTATWGDSAQNTVAANDQRNWNTPGDGKFDQSLFPGSLAMAVGRVDMHDLPSFSLSETELLRQYLNKNHRFRHKITTTRRQGLVDDNFGALGPVTFPDVASAGGWRNLAAFFGPANVVSAAWFPALTTQSYLWAYGCGPGTFTTCGGVTTTAQLAASDPQVVFTLMFGSFFGDYDSPDNLLRAVLACPSYTLTSAWSARPHWICHHMGLGETIGFSTLLTANQSAYDYNYAVDHSHIISTALLGDPTLRMHVVAPPRALAVNANALGGLDLGWNPSPDAVLGYYVYRASTADGPFTRVPGSGLVTTTWFRDASPAALTDTYMVRAVKLEIVNSGSYTNLSQGVFGAKNSGGLEHGDQIIANRSFYKGNGSVLIVHTNGNTQVLGNTWLKAPCTVVLDANGDILVACQQSSNGTNESGIFKLDHKRPSDPPTVVSQSTNFATPFGIALEPDQNILVADLDANVTGTILRVNPFTGTITTLSTGGNFNRLGGITVANNGGNESIFVTDQGDGTPANPPRLISIDPATGAQTVISSGGHFGKPAGLVVDPKGDTPTNIIVANAATNSPLTNGVLIAVTTNSISGGWTQSILTPGAPFASPTDLAIDPVSGDYLVSDGRPVPLASASNQGVGALYRVNKQSFSISLVSTNGFFEQPRGILVQP